MSCMRRSYLKHGYSYYPTNKLYKHLKEHPTNAGRQRVVPGPPLPSHALEKAASVESVARIASIDDGAACKMALVTDLVSELWNAWVFTMWKFKTWENNTNYVKEIFWHIIWDYRNCLFHLSLQIGLHFLLGLLLSCLTLLTLNKYRKLLLKHFLFLLECISYKVYISV